MKKRLSSLILCLGLVACTTPPAPRYQAPDTPAGRVCVQRCQQAEMACQTSCQQQQEHCRQKAEQQAKRELPERLAAWDIAIADWERAMQRYEMDLRFYELELQQRRLLRDLARDHCRAGDKRCRHHRPAFGYHYGRLRPLSPGPAPKRPTVESEAARLQTQLCSGDCGCGQAFNQCFTQCGGSIL